MKRKVRPASSLIIILYLVILHSFQGFAQDWLYFLDGVEMEVKITEVTTDYVKYKKLKEPEGPTLIMLKANLLKISHDNGTEELIENRASVE
ncbi:MAG: hypothetical protein H6601_09660, partial [Flavobacteriales bacterium]|nr:hypothetical protein [Flavobacteriales bacterium]